MHQKRIKCLEIAYFWGNQIARPPHLGLLGKIYLPGGGGVINIHTTVHTPEYVRGAELYVHQALVGVLRANPVLQREMEQSGGYKKLAMLFR